MPDIRKPTRDELKEWEDLIIEQMQEVDYAMRCFYLVLKDDKTMSEERVLKRMKRVYEKGMKKTGEGDRVDKLKRSDFSYYLREHRRATGLSQTKMADKLGVSRSALPRWESEKSTPRDVENLIMCVRNVTKDEIRRNRGW